MHMIIKTANLFVCLFLINFLHTPTSKISKVVNPAEKIHSGTWVVTGVRINTTLGKASSVTWNDPNLMYRVFRFSKEKISNNTFYANDNCTQPQYKQIDTKFNHLLFSTMMGYGDIDPSQDPSSDFEMSSWANKDVQINAVTCSNDTWNGILSSSSAGGKLSEIRGSWLAFYSKNKMSLRWHGNSILILKRFDDTNKLQPSFNCSRAERKDEIKICSSIELSGLDKSIHLAYKMIKKQNMISGVSNVPLTKGQKKWLTTRKSCDDDVSCLTKTMTRRIKKLSSMIEI